MVSKSRRQTAPLLGLGTKRGPLPAAWVSEMGRSRRGVGYGWVQGEQAEEWVWPPIFSPLEPRVGDRGPARLPSRPGVLLSLGESEAPQPPWGMSGVRSSQWRFLQPQRLSGASSCCGSGAPCLPSMALRKHLPGPPAPPAPDSGVGVGGAHQPCRALRSGLEPQPSPAQPLAQPQACFSVLAGDRPR